MVGLARRQDKTAGFVRVAGVFDPKLVQAWGHIVAALVEQGLQASGLV